jgi:hypothetical protein
MSIGAETRRLALGGVDFRTIDTHLRMKLGRDLSLDEEIDVLDAWRGTAAERDAIDARRCKRIADDVRTMRGDAQRRNRQNAVDGGYTPAIR